MENIRCNKVWTREEENYLEWSLMHTNLPFVRALLKEGAEIVIPYYILKSKSKQIAKTVIVSEKNNPIIHYWVDLIFLKACEENVKVIVVAFLELDVNINMKDKYGKTGLILASQYGNQEIVKILIEHGADINIKDDSGINAVTMAAMSENQKIVKMLVDAGADW